MGEEESADDWFDQSSDVAEDEDLFVGEWSVGRDEPDEDAHEVDEPDDHATGGDDVDEAAADLEDAFEELAGADAVEEAEAFEEPAETVPATEAGSDDGGGLFDQDFGEALGSAPDLPRDTTDDIDDDLGDEFDFGGEFDTGTNEFERLDSGGFDGDPDSDIDRITLGIEGLDAMIRGGVPARSLMVAIGSAGTGKTTLGLQFLAEGLRNGERAVYITLEESRQRVIRSATEKGFAYDEYTEDGDLAVVGIDPVEMANSLGSIRSELPRLIDEFGASRLVLDSVSLLEMMYDDRAARRNQIYNFTKSLKQSGVTTLLTSEASEETAYASRHGIVEYLTDAVFVLQYVRPSDFQETRLAIEIQKIRDANHSRETKPYEITDEGINVYRQANIF